MLLFALVAFFSLAFADDTNYVGQLGNGVVYCVKSGLFQYPAYSCSDGTLNVSSGAGDSGQAKSPTDDFYRYRLFLAFDTTAVATASAAQLYFVFSSDVSTTDFSLLVYSGGGSACWSATDNALTTADWNACITPETGTTFNTVNYPGNDVGFWWTIQASSVNVDGNTDFKLMSLRDEQSTATPTGNETVDVWTQNSVTTSYRPLLQVSEEVIPEYDVIVFVVVLVSSVAIAFIVAKKA